MTIIRLTDGTVSAGQGSGELHFLNVNDAFAYINQCGDDVKLLIDPGVYWLHNPDAEDTVVPEEGEKIPYGIRVRCKNLEIAGTTPNAKDVVIAANRGQSHGAIGNYTMFQITCRQLKLENITFGNFCSVDLMYDRDVSLNRAKRTSVRTQAQIGDVKGASLSAKNCRFLGRLNLKPFVGAEKSEYKNCYFECTDDEMNGCSLYEYCSFEFYARRPIYESYGDGAVFKRCRFVCHARVEEEDAVYFTKMGGPVTVEDSEFICSDDLKIAWTKYPDEKTVCSQKNIRKNGKATEILMPGIRDARQAADRVSPMPEDAPKIIDHVIDTDFSDMPTIPCAAVFPERWTIDSYRPQETYDWLNWFEDGRTPWKYGETGNGSVGAGFYQGTQGARLMFSHVDEKENRMDLTLWADPAKTLGQGFGAAGQYMDVLIHLDTFSMKGYGLRIIRLPEAGDGCFFALISCKGGVAKKLTEYQLSSVFRTGCMIHVYTEFQGEDLVMKADVTTKAGSISQHAAGDYLPEIHQSAMISPTGFLGFGILHTGTVGSGGWQNTTMLHRLKVVYGVDRNDPA